MTQAMMPPPLPGQYAPQAQPVPVAAPAPQPAPFQYPAPAQPAAAPQGYPGPAVPAPAPAPVAAPAQGQPYPAWQQPPQAAPAPAPVPMPPPMAAPVPVAPVPAPGFAPQPQQQPAYAPAPQQFQQPGYPPGYAPQQQGYAPQPQQPQQPQWGGQPGYMPAPQQGYAPQQQQPIGDIGAAIAGATGGDRAPQLGTGHRYKLEILETLVTIHPVEKKLTFLGRLRIVESTNPAQPPGAEATYVEGLQWGAGRVQAFLVAGCGYPAKAAYDQAMASMGKNPEIELKALGNACADPATQHPQSHYSPNPLKGRFLYAATQTIRKIPRQGKNAGKETDFLSIQWAPA